VKQFGQFDQRQVRVRRGTGEVWKRRKHEVSAADKGQGSESSKGGRGKVSTADKAAGR
jgi:hypothetical protein